MDTTLHIGIDGGGTGCRVVAVAGGREARAEGGPANVVTDPAAAEAAIRLALADALGPLDLSLEDLTGARIVAGLAGCRLPGVADAFAMRLSVLAYVVDDSVTALEGAFAGAEGTLVNLGTGSFLIRRDGRGVTHQGGWGFDLGDEGSAAWLGHLALSQLCRIEDGRLDHFRDDPLRAALLAEIGAHPVLFARDAGPEDFAALAPIVLAHPGAWADDLQGSVEAELRRGLRDIGHPEGAPWVLTGGLGKALAGRLRDTEAAGLQAPKGSALDGALAMARALP
ncbi:BadF/BadG/BcrA/BcrD ATPase family protein [Hasllibacter sp. MH4015]|uniref:BadF/BadG/BcrA/BcrD ATPase family protein n=1 Tax=Hasllibacter sp. MH4015 TaxID=2854029 RepID=UPI001CD73D1E|nr:BadF/BadG/BcrA/BcrD ATPase family protein [Hasllibacter sp. MH4015]